MGYRFKSAWHYVECRCSTKCTSDGLFEEVTNQLGVGEACVGSLDGGTWRSTDDFCVNPVGATDESPMFCVEGACQEVCDSEFNTGPILTCPAGTTCGFLDFFSSEIAADVAICD